MRFIYEGEKFIYSLPNYQIQYFCFQTKKKKNCQVKDGTTDDEVAWFIRISYAEA